MFRYYSLLSFTLCLLSKGVTTIVLSKFDTYNMLSAVQNYNVTFLPSVPLIFIFLWYILTGGAPLCKEGMDEFMEKYLTVKFLQGCFTDIVEESHRFGSSSLFTLNTEVKIVHSQCMALNEEAALSTLSSDGWLRTGYICYIDDDGFIFVVDRLKKLINYQGYQVAAAEFEVLLLTHPHVFDKEVVQIPMAYVVGKPESNIFEIAVKVAPYKRLRWVAFIKPIPKNPSDRIPRKDLIKLATSNL
ncbi:hypothetical protein M9H77_18924 [Catharanthus roseus]|uniref:Uncharacterized protein n=1 Tax=Catharanthus roseus TaxID=4058 RepID=A0ACC0B8V3_CATRO|nr:hypothetical protein M9H77_18924 [Catharanthus roseus]